MEYSLTTNNLCKYYGRTKALNGLNMKIPKGSIYGLVGRNGAGKTTLFRVICGLQRPTLGGYTLYGIEHTDKGIYDSYSRLGVLVETPAFYRDMTGEENLREQYRVIGLPSYQGIPELLSSVGLAEVRNRKAWKYSLGMRKRLGIAIALAGDPDFLVLDEPMSGLDPQGIIEIRELLLKLNRERQVTILISGHGLDELSRIATHYGFIDHGRMVREMNAAELQYALKKCMHIRVSDTRSLSIVLDEMKFEYQILSDREADIFADVNVSQLVTALAKVNCEVYTMQERNESMEGYFLSMLDRK